MNVNGEVIGVVVAKLNSLWMLKYKGDLPQNINYAIKSNYLMEVLRSVQGLDARLPKERPTKSRRPLENVLERVENATVLIVVETKSDTTAESVDKQRPPSNSGERSSSAPSGCRSAVDGVIAVCPSSSQESCQERVLTMTQVCRRSSSSDRCISQVNTANRSCNPSSSSSTPNMCRVAAETLAAVCQ